jgi:hypothetical protein
MAIPTGQQGRCFRACGCLQVPLRYKPIGFSNGCNGSRCLKIAAVRLPSAGSAPRRATQAGKMDGGQHPARSWPDRANKRDWHSTPTTPTTRRSTMEAKRRSTSIYRRAIATPPHEIAAEVGVGVGVRVRTRQANAARPERSSRACNIKIPKYSQVRDALPVQPAPGAKRRRGRQVDPNTLLRKLAQFQGA